MNVVLASAGCPLPTNRVEKKVYWNLIKTEKSTPTLLWWNPPELRTMTNREEKFRFRCHPLGMCRRTQTFSHKHTWTPLPIPTQVYGGIYVIYRLPLGPACAPASLFNLSSFQDLPKRRGKFPKCHLFFVSTGQLWAAGPFTRPGPNLLLVENFFFPEPILLIIIIGWLLLFGQRKDGGRDPFGKVRYTTALRKVLLFLVFCWKSSLRDVCLAKSCWSSLTMLLMCVGFEEDQNWWNFEIVERFDISAFAVQMFYVLNKLSFINYSSACIPTIEPSLWAFGYGVWCPKMDKN